MGYRHIQKLGGLLGWPMDRAPSRNTFRENPNFRNYADYAAMPDFREGMEELHDLGRVHTCSIMCAEAVWWRYHWRIIADYLLADGDTVFHILGPGKVKQASLNLAAIMEPNWTLVYPALEDRLLWRAASVTLPPPNDLLAVNGRVKAGAPAAR